MDIETAGQTPARMSIANVSSGDSIDAQFNPTEFEEALEVNWARQTVPGLSHQPLRLAERQRRTSIANTRRGSAAQVQAPGVEAPRGLASTSCAFGSGAGRP
jgi:hypothetical protein